MREGGAPSPHLNVPSSDLLLTVLTADWPPTGSQREPEGRGRRVRGGGVKAERSSL